MWANFQLNFTPIGNIIVLLTTLQSWSMRTSLLIHRLCIAVFHTNILMTANFQLNFTSISDLISFVNRSSQNWHLRASPFLCHFVDYTCISYRGGPIFSLTLHRFGNVIVFLIQHRETGIWGRLKYTCHLKYHSQDSSFYLIRDSFQGTRWPLFNAIIRCARM